MKAYAIKTIHNVIIPWSIRKSEKECIEDHLVYNGLYTWNELLEMGFSVVKIEIKEVD